MGLAIAVLTWLWNKGEGSRVGRIINTTLATVVCVGAFIVALALINLVIFRLLGI
jgi:hypothetical protein